MSQVTAISPLAPSRRARRRRRLEGVLALSVSLAALGALAALLPSSASAVTPLAPPPVRDEDRADQDHLVVTVRRAGGRADGVFEVWCRPGGGRHPDVSGACRAVERNTRWGRDPFAPVPSGVLCTMRYGGPATAHVSGRWAGRPVDTTYDRRNGCAIERCDRMVPLLPALSDRLPAPHLLNSPRGLRTTFPRGFPRPPGGLITAFPRPSHALPAASSQPPRGR
ncbi:SSI family serine proteinase inhibitor [Streptomyces sp. NBC_00582]|uniref:SSI family serine proteinase inhibitor n=1 Tax=Streptomyces sp. NBC_00582 TaxID=2975783 RepID=UPI003FCDDE4D